MKYKINDNELIYMIRENDEYYLNTLFKKYEPIVINICNTYYNSCDYLGVDYDDLKQECYIGLYNAYLKFNSSKNNTFYTYAVTCMKNHMKTYYRNINVKKNRVLNNSIFVDNYDFVGDEYSIMGNLDNSFIDCKNLFDLKHSIVFELRYNGFSYKEISKLLDIPISTVDSRLCKIRSILRKYCL